MEACIREVKYQVDVVGVGVMQIGASACPFAFPRVWSQRQPLAVVYPLASLAGTLYPDHLPLLLPQILREAVPQA